MKRNEFLKFAAAGAAALVVSVPLASKAATVPVLIQIADSGSGSSHVTIDGPSGQIFSWSSGMPGYGSSFNIDSSESFTVTIFNNSTLNPSYTTVGYNGYYDEKQPYSFSNVTYGPIHAVNTSAYLSISISDYI